MSHSNMTTMVNLMTNGIAIRNISAILGGVVFAYVASFGPVCGYTMIKNLRMVERVETFYWPILTMYRYSPALNDAAMAYIQECVNMFLKSGVQRKKLPGE
jgi:hypothetical protein